MGIPFVLIWVIGIPLACFLVLRLNLRTINTPVTRASYAILYAGLKPKYYFWELVHKFRKLILIAISIFFSISLPSTHGLLAILLILIFARKQSTVSPYKINLLNKLQNREILSSLFTLYGGLFFKEPQISEESKVVVAVMIFGFNVWFYSLWIWAFI